MPFDIVPFRLSDPARFRPLLDDPALAREFDILLPPGQLERQLTDRLAAPDASLLAFERGTPAGFTLGFALPEAGGGFRAVLRLGVATRFWRRGLGTALLERAAAAFAQDGTLPSKLQLAAWQPAPEADAFVARHGFAHARWYWRMSRAPLPVPAPVWPAGVETRVFDGSIRMIRDWTAAYNDSFAEHWGYIPGTTLDARSQAADPLFLAGGLIVAYRGEAPIGFCRNESVGTTGVVGVLGVSPAARGIGLGRALLRWSVAYLDRAGYEKVSLEVDGENETARRLYVSEGFEVERTRHIWSRPFAAPPGLSAGRSAGD